MFLTKLDGSAKVRLTSGGASKEDLAAYWSPDMNPAVGHQGFIAFFRPYDKRGADATRAMDFAQRGLAGDFEDETVYDPAEPTSTRRLDREGYREIIELLRELGIGSRQ